MAETMLKIMKDPCQSLKMLKLAKTISDDATSLDFFMFGTFEPNEKVCALLRGICFQRTQSVFCLNFTSMQVREYCI